MVDVAIIADISESISNTQNNKLYLLDFIKHMISNSAVDSGDVRFALSLYSHIVYNYFHFNTHTTVAQMIADINATPLPNYGGTNTGDALQHLHADVFQTSMGDRGAAPNIAIVITDGKSSDNAHTVQQANSLKNQGVHVIVVGIGSNIDTVELHQIASDPTFENVFNVDDFNELFTIQDVIEDKFIEECKGNII
jgi:collagen type XII alpha